jgi:hypothetical protein
MPKFKLRDPVRVTAPSSRHFDEVGTVTDVDANGNPEYPFGVSGLVRRPLWFAAHELVLAERAPTKEPS